MIGDGIASHKSRNEPTYGDAVPSDGILFRFPQAGMAARWEAFPDNIPIPYPDLALLLPPLSGYKKSLA